ncbi:MAG: hypothetical protein GTO20_29340 [Candidatus Aminicenantes bacterium]|nr:hypothetical protein [Candidatus Aminicenantes bacterium]
MGTGEIKFLQLMVPGWLKSGTRFDSLKLNNINGLDDPTVFEVPTSYEKGTNLLGKKLTTVMKILIKLVLPGTTFFFLETLSIVIERSSAVHKGKGWRSIHEHWGTIHEPWRTIHERWRTIPELWKLKINIKMETK